MQKNLKKKINKASDILSKIIKQSKSFMTLVYEIAKKMPRRRLQIILVIIVLVFGFGVSKLLKHSKKAPVKVEKAELAPLVKVEVVHKQDVQMIVKGYGTVQPKTEVEIVPQVAGKIVAINEGFNDGGFVKAGEALITIDPRDYELMVQSAQAQVAKAEVDLEIEIAEAEVSRQEWDQLNPGKEPASLLVVREPQIRQAKTLLQAANAELSTAELNLERTKVTVPFDCRVVSKSVDLGQYVTIGQPVGAVYAIDAVEIEVPIEDWELGWFDVPASPVSINGGEPKRVGSEVEVRSKFAGGLHTWHGMVVRTAGKVDQMSRLVHVIIEVEDPFDTSDGNPPLVPGMFVEVFIKGKTLKGIIPIARDAIHEGDKLWVVNDSKLHIKRLEIVRSDEKYAYTILSIDDGAVIVVSSLDAVTEGMKVRIQLEEVTSDDKDKAKGGD